MDQIDALEAERRNLLALAYRMLGTVADAEDAVQETYLRWCRLTGVEREQIVNPAAWLTRVAGRVCLDHLGAASREAHDAVARAFAEATATGDLAALIGVLDPDVVLRADGGGKISAARRPVFGADRVARFLLGLPHLEPAATIEPTRTPEGLAFLVRLHGRADSVISVDVAGDRIVAVYMVRNPDKLTLWR